MKRTQSDLIIAITIAALLIFGHVATIQSAHASTGQLLLQGAGSSYGPTVDNRYGQMETQARDMLKQLGQAERSYASNSSSGHYAYIDELALSGGLQPNASGAGLTPGYSISFFIPAMKNGFTLVAEPTDYQLRPLMIDESNRVVVLTPTLQSDPGAMWKTARDRMEISLNNYGYYMYPISIDLSANNPPLQVRIDWAGRNYVLLSLYGNKQNGYRPDQRVIYDSYLSTYLLGDTRYE